MNLSSGFLKYVQSENAIEQLSSDLYGVHDVALISGNKAYAAFSPRFQLPDAKVHLLYWNRCAGTWAQGQELAEKVLSHNCSCIIGVGGGEMMDIAKAAASLSGKPLYLVPTAAATCSCCTTLIALYDEKGRRSGKAYLPCPIAGVYADERILLSAPKRYLCSGVADGLAKLSEANSAILYGTNPEEPLWNAQFSQALHLAKSYIKEVPRALSGNTDAQKSLIYSNFYLVSQISADRCERKIAELAHVLHNVLTQMFPEVKRSHLHGEIVGVGVLMELEMTGAVYGISRKTIQSLLQNALHCPTTLRELGIPTDDLTIARISASVAEKTKLSPTRIAPVLKSIR